MEGGREQNYWPGFVDALSNVVLTLVFVLVIFVFALVMASSQLEQQIREKIEAEKSNVATGETSDITVADEVTEKIKEDTSPVHVEGAASKIVLNFPPGTTKIDQDASNKLSQAFDTVQKSVGKHKVIMLSTVGREAYSTARRLAYYRAIDVRSYLISKLGEQPGNITISIVNSTQLGDGRVEIVFQKE